MKNKVLFITQHLPFPPCSGARRREYELLKYLTNSNNVTLLAISKVYEEDKQMINLMNLNFDGVYLFHANPEKLLKDANDEKVSLQMCRNSSSQAKLEISKIIQNHKIEVIHIEGFYMYSILPKNLNVPVVLCEQNIEYDIWAQQVLLHPEIENEYIKQAEIVKKEEELVWKCVNKIVTVTVSDASIINKFGINDVSVVTNGYDHTPFLTNNDITDFNIDKMSHNLLYVGNYDYRPNEDAAFYFVDEILPLIKNKIKNIKIYFVGNIGTSNIEKLRSDDVYVTGRVDNLDEYYKKSSIFICPLRYGGGIKTKILEALYASKSIVTSSIGLQGIDIPIESPFVIADNPTDFANEVVRLLSNDLYRSQKEAACKNVLSMWTTWNKAADLLTSIYSNAIIENI